MQDKSSEKELPYPCALCPFRPRCRGVSQHQILSWTSRCPILKDSVENLSKKRQADQPKPAALFRLFKERVEGFDPSNLN